MQRNLKRGYMRSELTVSAVVVVALLECLEHNGLAQDDISRITAFDFNRAKDPDFQTPYQVVLQLWEMAVQATGDLALGIHLREQYAPNLTHYCAYVGINSENGLEALKYLCRYSRLLSDAYLIDLDIHQDLASIRITCIAPQALDNWTPEWLFSSIVFYKKRRSALEVQSPVKVCFQHACPTSIQEYIDYFKVQVLFDQPENRLFFEKKPLLKKYKLSNPHLHTTLKDHAEIKLQQVISRQKLTSLVQKHIVQQLPTGTLSFESTAEALNKSRSSLYRELREEGSSYSSLLLEIRKLLTKGYLEKGMKTSQIAHLTGYTDISNFLKATKSWFGESLGKYRSTKSNDSTTTDC